LVAQDGDGLARFALVTQPAREIRAQPTLAQATYSMLNRAGLKEARILARSRFSIGSVAQNI
jgi:hypothetical protein